MGHPKRIRKKYEPPKRPYDNLEEEKKLLDEFGLRKKRELWKARTILRNFRRRAREMQAIKNPEEEKKLLDKMNKLGLNVSSLDDVLKITVKDILSRRLETIVFKKGLGNTIKHARQLIVHGHILFDKRKLTCPSFLVPVDMEDKIILSQKIKNIKQGA
ncbi:MAG: 30S ribosomal protein S4 [Candidatus Aenigmarchaeota archaeon]|nr:30S ribosomal protein S4 [Candidatus Aenigmarchaeota archaeon]